MSAELASEWRLFRQFFCKSLKISCQKTGMEMKIPERLKGIFNIFKSERHDQCGEENKNVYDTLTPKVSNDARMNE